MRRVLQAIIRVYQKTLSPDHGVLSRFRRAPTCRFYPTCSEYAHQAIGRFGAMRGGLLALRRLARCHPWSKGGEDEVRNLF